MRFKRKLIPLILVLALILPQAVSVYAADEGRAIIFVAPDGNDENAGTISSPLATPEGARDKIRELKKTGAYPKGYTVYFRGGNYFRTKGFVLTAEDSGTEAAPVVYRNYQDETVTFVGGANLTGKDFEKLTDKELTSRIVDSAARDKIYYVDLKKYGIENIGSIPLPGAYTWGERNSAVAASEVLFNGSGMTMARYPNTGNITIEKIIEKGYDTDIDNGLTREAPFVIEVNDDRMEKWTKAPKNSIGMFGFWKFDWADESILLGEFDTSTKRITSAWGSCFSLLPGRGLYVYNLIEELDVPGEYYVDYENSILYMYPPSDISKAKITLSIMEDRMVTFENTEYITLKNLDFIASRNNVIYMTGGHHNVVDSSEISFSASFAVIIESGHDNIIKNSYIHDVNGGVQIDGGDFYTLTPANNMAINNHIERFSRITKTYTSALRVGGVGNKVAYNEVHDAPHLAVEFSGNNNEIEYNEIYNVLQSADDSSAIYGGISWVGRGTQIKYNYAHDFASDTSSGGVGVSFVYVDGGGCETYCVGNVVENLKGYAFKYNGGRDNITLNNIVINSGAGLELTDAMLTVNLDDRYYGALEKSDYVNGEAYKNAFPKLQEMLDDPEIRHPKGNIYKNNLLVNTEYAKLQGIAQQYADITGNYKVDGNPGFYDMKNRDYTLKEDSEVFEKLPDFKPVPFSRMGRFDDLAEVRMYNTIVLKTDSPYSFVDGKKAQIDEENENIVPIIQDSRTYVPLRFIAEALGYQVGFDKDTQTISVLGNNTNLELTVGSKNAKKNGEAIELENVAFIKEGRTLVPLREFSELFGKQVYWNPIGFISISDDAELYDDNSEFDMHIVDYIAGKLDIY